MPAKQPYTPFLVAPETPQHRAATINAVAFAALPFGTAADLWIETRRNKLRKRTLVSYHHHVQQLNKFFGNIRLRDIHIGNLIDYQRARTENEEGRWPKPAGPSYVNHELSVIQQIMKHGRVWERIGDLYEALPLPGLHKPKVMAELEKRRLFTVASGHPEWQLAYWISMITANTGAAGCELRNVRFEDVMLDAKDPVIVISTETAKNVYRGRTVPLNAMARSAIEKCMDRGREFGSVAPSHYVFPFRVKPGVWDPMRPTTDAWLRRTFSALREAAGLPWLTPHCLRHQFITELGERGVPAEVIRSLVGHVSDRMMRHYMHGRIDTQMAAVKLLETVSADSKSERRSRARQQREILARRRRRLPQGRY